MSQPNINKPMKWMIGAMIACCAIPIAIALLFGGGLGVFFSRSSPDINQPETSSVAVVEPSLEPVVGNWRENNHVHGLAVNPDNPQVVYVASHNGLLQRSQDGKWYWVKKGYDYMGFTAHPSDSQRFYASGHPPTGGNLGFQISSNKGQDWQQISMPGVDFHALAIAPSDPNIFYGWASSGARGLFISTDGGKTWQQSPATGLGDHPFNLVVDSNDSKHIYAITGSGLYESFDSGNKWKLIQNDPIVGLAINNSQIYGYRLLKSSPGLYQSSDGGKSWQKLGQGIDGTILYLAIAPKQPQIIYGVNENNTVFQSQDRGTTWKEI